MDQLSCNFYICPLIILLKMCADVTGTFIYDDANFLFNVPCSNTYSEFDNKLRSQWNEKLEKNLFRYRLNNTKEKCIGVKFYLQLNIDRAVSRRQPAEILTINQSFDRSVFNFLKIKPEEKLFYIARKDKPQDSSKHVVMINVSPVENGHVLFVPRLTDELPQILTEDTIILSIELILLSNTSHFRMGFNSLGGCATVNHLHFHGYYLPRNMFLETSPVEEISDPCYRILDFPGQGFVFQIRCIEEINAIAINVYKLVELMVKMNIAHNLYITRGIPFESIPGTYDKEMRSCVRIFVWPRKPSFGVKNLSNLNPATCELFGHLVVKDEAEFESLNEVDINEILKDLTNEEFNKVMKNINEIFPVKY